MLTLNEITKNLPFPAFSLDPEGALSSMNAPMAALLEIEAGSAIGRPLALLLSAGSNPAHWAAFEGAAREAVLQGVPQSLAVRIEGAEGKGLRLYRFTFSPLQDASGEVLGVLVAAEPPEPEAVERRMQECEAKLREREKELSCFFAISDLIDGRVQTLEETLKAVVDLIPSAWQYPEIACARLMVNSWTFQTDNFEESGTKLVSPIRVNGEVCGALQMGYLENRAAIGALPFIQEERRLLNAISMRVGKIVEAIQAQQKLRAADERFRAIVEQIPAVVYSAALDEGFGAFYVSPQIKPLLGYTPAEWVADARLWMRSIHPEDRERVLLANRECILHQELFREEYRMFTRMGELRWIHDEAMVINDEQGRPLFFQGVLVDITSTREAAEAEQKRRREAETLQEITTALTASLDLNQVLDNILNHLHRTIPYERAGVYLQEGDDLNLVAWRGIQMDEGENGRAFPANGRLYQDIQNKRAPIILEEQALSLRLVPGIERGWMGSWMGVPLLVQDEVFGILTLDTRETGAYGPDEANLAQAFANQAAIGITNAKLYSQVMTSRERLQNLSSRLVEVQEAERRRIARELHDEIGQALTGLKLLLEMTAHLPDKDQIASLESAIELIDELMNRVRELSLDLRPAMLDDLGLLPALLWHFERFSTQTGVQVNLRQQSLDGKRFDPEVETAVYRIIQEALTNAARYARVDQVEVRIWTNEEYLGVQVMDRGCGFEVERAMSANTTNGLTGMRERAVLLGGVLTLTSTPDEGTTVTAIFPLSNYFIERRAKDGQHSAGR